MNPPITVVEKKNIPPWPSCRSKPSTNNHRTFTDAPESKRDVDVPPSRLCWGKLFTCNSCINLHDQEFIISRRLILETGSEKLKKIERRISRNHFALKLQNTVNGLHTVRLIDLSTKGTFVNGHRIGKNKTITLFNDDVISIVHPNYNVFKFKDLIRRFK